MKKKHFWYLAFAVGGLGAYWFWKNRNRSTASGDDSKVAPGGGVTAVNSLSPMANSSVPFLSNVASY